MVALNSIFEKKTIKCDFYIESFTYIRIYSPVDIMQLIYLYQLDLLISHGTFFS